MALECCSVDDKTWRILSSLIICLAGVSHGSMLSWPAEVLPQLTSPYSSFGWLTQNILTWIASISYIGCMIGSLLASPMQKFMSTRVIVCCSSLFATLSWLLVSLSTSPFSLCASRVSLGCANAVLMSVVPPYISSTSPPAVRGALSSCYALALGLGLMFSVSLGAKISWASLSMLASLPPLLLSLASPFLHPGGPAACSSEEDSSTNNQVKAPKPRLLFFFLTLIYCLCGVGPLGSFPEQLFPDHRTFLAYDLAMASLVCQTVGGLIGAAVIDKLGRKPVLRAGAWLCLLANIVLSIYFSTVDQNLLCPTNPGSVLCWAPAIATCIFFIGFGGGLGNIYFVLLGELIPAHKIATVIPLVTFFFNFLQFSVIKSFLFFNMIIGTSSIFFLQAGINIFFLFGQAAWLPESKPRSPDLNLQGQDFQASYGTFVPSNVQVTKYSVATSDRRPSDGGEGLEFVLNNTEFIIAINRKDSVVNLQKCES